MQLAEARPDGDALPDEARRDAVAVALEGDHRGARDDTLTLKQGRERRTGQREQALCGGELCDRPALAFALIRDRGRPTFCVSAVGELYQ